MTGFRPIHAALVVGLLIAFTVVLSACGSSNSSSSSTSSATESSETTAGSSGESTSSSLEAIKASVAKAEQPPTPISLPDHAKTPESGRSIVIVTCPLGPCITISEGTKAAASVLGWNAKIIQGGLTPETQVTAWTEASQLKPDVIFGTTILPQESYKTPWGEAASAHIPIVAYADPETPPPGVIAAIGATEKTETITGEAQGEWIVANADGKPVTVGVFDSPEQPAAHIGAGATKKAIEAGCPECTIKTEDFNLEEIGTKIPGKAVSFLQRNPDIEYLTFPFGAAGAGVAVAIKSAGLTLPKIVTRAPSLENQTNIVKGLEAVTVPEEVESAGWRGVDVAARYLEGESTNCCSNPVTEYQIVTKENIKDAGAEWTVPDLEDSFRRIWKLSE